MTNNAIGYVLKTANKKLLVILREITWKQEFYLLFLKTVH